jgi:hypothetical protein
MKKFTWKVWLKLNPLTKDVDNDYIAEVSTVGKTLSSEDIARLIVEGGSELHYETVLDIIKRAGHICIDKLQEGYSVQTEVCRIAPRVSGAWHGASTAFDPKTHKVTLTITPTNTVRDALDDVAVEVLGIRDSGAFIGLVSDVTTKAIDGTITPGGQVIITGDKIKVEGDPEETGIGVFLDSSTSTFQLTSLAVNHPREIIGMLPRLNVGNYTLYIVTRFASGKILLKEPRRIEYKTTLKVL